MKFITILILLASSIIKLNAQNTWQDALKAKTTTLNVSYYDQFPFIYKDKAGKLTGIEYDIMQEFIKWTKKAKKLKLHPCILGIAILMNFIKT